MRVAFCQHYFYEYLGVMMLSAQLKRHGHEVELFIQSLDGLSGAVAEGRFDLVCFTMMSNDVNWGAAAARRLKALRPSLPIAVGGPHTTFFPGFLAEHPEFDVACVGEGDEAILDLARAIEAGEDYSRIPNLVVRTGSGELVENPVRPLIEDLDSLPFADRQLYRKFSYFRRSSVFYLIASRGCPYDCNFCFNHRYKALYRTARFRLRSPENIIAEVKAIQAQGIEIGLLVFVDSTINLDAAWCVDLFRKYREQLDVRFSVNMAAGQVSEEIVRALAETGSCRSVCFAIEVGDEKMRREVLRKNLSNADILRAARLLRAHGIRIYAYLMFGIPFETAETALRTIEFCQEVRPDFVKPALFVPYRELDVTRLALEHGFVTPEDLVKLDDARFGAMESAMRLSDIAIIKNLFYLSVLMIHLPRLQPVLLRLVKLQGGALFRMAYLVSFLLQVRRFFRMPWRRSLVEFAYHRKET
jgi:radical SAM superfamily enzyme YgiQ (UPF0313 family)